MKFNSLHPGGEFSGLRMPKRTPKQDPHAAREAEQYDNPIASREFILLQLEQADRPLTRQELEQVLDLTEDDQREALRRRLRAMERDGQLYCNRRGGYGPLDKMNLVHGRVQAHRDGFGFLVVDGEGDDLYLGSRQMSRVFDGDVVLARVAGTDRRGRQEAAIVQVLEHNTRQLVGRYQEQDGLGVVVPDNPRIQHDVLVPSHARGDARPGQYVVVDITAQPGRRQGPRGEVVEVLGEHMAPGMETEVALRNYGIPFQWPEEVLREARELAPEPEERDKQDRVDLRDLILVTIDGEDARDFDDAVYCEARREGGWRLWVAIADVSHYVFPGSALDAEARRRGNSVYFPDRVIPMLPEELSNGLCSLNPDVDRLCMVCEMTISTSGKVTGYRFQEALICSRARLTYTQVAAVLNPEHRGHEHWTRQLAPLLPHLRHLHDAFRALRGARERRGAIDFDTVETRVIFDDERKIERIVPVVRNDAHKLIEECMLAANVAAARLLERARLPALYRVHQGPSAEKLASLRKFLGELGLDLGGGDEPDPTHYQRLLEQAVERPDAHVIQTMLLRSLSQACYQPANEGHFGLHYPAYTHFTSPIRRYPDLLVHRALRHLVQTGQATVMPGRRARAGQAVDSNRSRKKNYPYGEGELAQLGEHCSMTERRADEATRDVLAWLKCEYLQERVGEVYPGVITAVTGFGLFVELKDLYIEGLVHVSALPGDYYSFDPAHQRLIGERSRAVYQLGSPLRVQVARVDLEDRKIDLEPVIEPEAETPARTPGRSPRRRRRNRS